MLFSVAKQITVQVATQRNVNAPLPTATQRRMGRKTGVLSGTLERRCDAHKKSSHKRRGRGPRTYLQSLTWWPDKDQQAIIKVCSSIKPHVALLLTSYLIVFSHQLSEESC